MGELTNKIRSKFLRRASARSSAPPSTASSNGSSKSERGQSASGRPTSLSSQCSPSFIEAPRTWTCNDDKDNGSGDLTSSVILEKEGSTRTAEGALDGALGVRGVEEGEEEGEQEEKGAVVAVEEAAGETTLSQPHPPTPAARATIPGAGSNPMGDDQTSGGHESLLAHHEEGSESLPKKGVNNLPLAMGHANQSHQAHQADRGSEACTKIEPGPEPTPKPKPTLAADNDTSHKMGNDRRQTLPSIYEHPHDPTTSTESAATTTDEDEFEVSSPWIQEPSTPTARAFPVPVPASVSVSVSASGTSHTSNDDAGRGGHPLPTPTLINPFAAIGSPVAPRRDNPNPTTAHAALASSGSSLSTGPAAATRPDPTRAQSHLPSLQAQLIRTLLAGAANAEELHGPIANADHLLPIGGAMVGRRKIWVRRPGASATLVTINEGDVVDDVRDMILRKYANSLGRQFDSPDLTLRIVPREQRVERTLNPDEQMARIIDAYYPGGQAFDEALIIDVPLRRTPKPSPRTGPPHAPHIASAVYFSGPVAEDVHAAARPSEAGTDYFGPAAAVVATTAHLANGTQVTATHPHSIGVLTTGQIPQIPSPGGSGGGVGSGPGARTRSYRERPDRPRLGRQHTSSPTILGLVGPSQAASLAATATNVDQQGAAPAPSAATIPTPPAPADQTTIQRVSTPPPRVASPRPPAARAKKAKKLVDHPFLGPGIMGGGVPPINVLIVEDNPINLKLLEVFVKRLKVRWQTAVNGREAVDKWRQGGFHLVLMDIQLPVMSGLDATREIRRLERVNNIGLFSNFSSASSAPPDDTASTNGSTTGSLGGQEADQKGPQQPSEEDRLVSTDLFRSPVIIVALTASSLQSDRQQALAAGCNDFLTKPVNFVWFEKKIMEWGCMQALIDFDGWRKWKDFAKKAEEREIAARKPAVKAKAKRNRSSLTTNSSSGGAGG